MPSSYIRLYTVAHVFLMATSMLAASYAKFQNGLSKAIVSIIKPIETFSTGDQFVAVRCLYSNEVNNVKDSFLLCKASALFQQVILHVLGPNLRKFCSCHSCPAKVTK
jgi:hypothetical protein